MKKLVKLSYINTLEERLRKGSPLIQVLLGPRQVGKTTSVLNMIKTEFPTQAHYVSADQVFNASPSWLVEQWVKARSEKKILIVDEIQKCENWAEVVKKLFDENKKTGTLFPCVLLGSSSLEIHKGMTESLTGRFQLIQAHHWNYAESVEGYGLNFEDYLRRGGYPGSYDFTDIKEWSDYVRNSIVSTVIEKDILQYQTVRSPALFRQAFEILMSYPAQEISYTKILGQLQDRGNVELVKYYISLYEGAYLVKALEKFSAKKIITKASSPKILPLAPCFYFLSILDTYRSDERGRAFELLVGAQLVRTGEELYYWREGKDEVDFILKRGRKIWAIEVKTGDSRSKSGLIALKKKFPSAVEVFIDESNYFNFEKDPMKFLEECGGA